MLIDTILGFYGVAQAQRQRTSPFRRSAAVRRERLLSFLDCSRWSERLRAYPFIMVLESRNAEVVQIDDFHGEAAIFRVTA